MSLFDDIDDENEDTSSAPVDSLAGPQTSREQVMQRIAQVRGGGDDPSVGPSQDGLPVGGLRADPAAIEFAKNSAMTAGMGRALNTLAQGMGAKVDNASFDAMEKRGSDMVSQDLNRQAAIRKAIESRKAKAGSNELRDLQVQKLKAELGSPEFSFKNKLPVENQEQIKELTKSNANKTDIKSAIDSALVLLKDPKVSEDQKIAAGQSLLKTLNSDQGKDAVGAEESKRLGSFLQYKMANMTQPGSFWGRDMDQFVTQVENKSGALANSMASNSDKINELYGRSGGKKNAVVQPVHDKHEAGGVIPTAMAEGDAPAADPQIDSWAKQNHLPYAQAAKILKSRGYGQ